MQNNQNCIDDLILVSVIIPVYNIEKYLRRCIDSVVNQTLSKIEIILINDGSTDSSGAICDSYFTNFSFVKVVHQDNLGVSAARNAGLKIAKGKYISFLDSDDWLDLDLLTNLYDSASKNDVDYLISGYVVEWIDTDEKEFIGVDDDYNYTNTLLFKNALILLEEKSLSCGSIAKLYKKSVLENNNIHFPVGVSWCEDALFNLTFLQKSSSVMISKIKGYHVHRESGLVSLTRRFVPNMFEIESLLYIKRLAFYDLLMIDDEPFLKFTKRRYSLALMWCLSNLYKKDSILEKRDRLRYISLIFNELDSRSLYSFIPDCRFNIISLTLFRFCNLSLFDIVMCNLFKIRNLIK